MTIEMASISEIDKQIADLKLTKKNIIKEREDKKTPVKENEEKHQMIQKWKYLCDKNKQNSEEVGRKGWLNKKLWRASVVSSIYYKSDLGRLGHQSYTDLCKLHQEKADQEEKPTKLTYYMTVRTEVELDFYPSWKCPICLKTLKEMEGETVNEMEIKELKCGHRYCVWCLSQMEDYKCPLCRKKFIYNNWKDVRDKV